MFDIEWKDIITGLGLVLVIIGWLFSRWKDRNHEIFKERLKRRLDMYDSIVDALLPFFNPKNGQVDLDGDTLSAKLSVASTKIQLFGYQDETDEFKSFISKLKDKDLDGVNCSLKKLSPMIVNNIRKELRY